MTVKQFFSITVLILAMLLVFTACGSENAAKPQNTANAAKTANTAEPAGNAGTDNTAAKASLADGTYSVKFDTDSSMFHINESLKGRATLTVKDGRLMLHVTLQSKNITKLFKGKAADASKDGAKVIDPTTDTVKYSDGATEEVYGFDVEDPILDEEFDLAILGTKGKWYDHKVSISDPQPVKE